MKHTSGKVIFEQTTRVDTALDKFIRTEDGYPIAWAYETANAELICEAFNVTNETGKSPRQLADEKKELLELLDLIILNEINLEQEGKKCNFSGPVYLKALQLKNKGSHQQSN